MNIFCFQVCSIRTMVNDGLLNSSMCKSWNSLNGLMLKVSWMLMSSLFDDMDTAQLAPVTKNQ